MSKAFLQSCFPVLSFLLFVPLQLYFSISLGNAIVHSATLVVIPLVFLLSVYILMPLHPFFSLQNHSSFWWKFWDISCQLLQPLSFCPSLVRPCHPQPLCTLAFVNLTHSCIWCLSSKPYPGFVCCMSNVNSSLSAYLFAFIAWYVSAHDPNLSYHPSENFYLFQMTPSWGPLLLPLTIPKVLFTAKALHCPLVSIS